MGVLGRYITDCHFHCCWEKSETQGNQWNVLPGGVLDGRGKDADARDGVNLEHVSRRGRSQTQRTPKWGSANTTPNPPVLGIYFCRAGFSSVSGADAVERVESRCAESSGSSKCLCSGESGSHEAALLQICFTAFDCCVVFCGVDLA